MPDASYEEKSSHMTLFSFGYINCYLHCPKLKFWLPQFPTSSASLNTSGVPLPAFHSSMQQLDFQNINSHEKMPC